MEAKLSLNQASFPIFSYETSSYDLRDFGEVQVLDRFDAFMESLGLTLIETEEKGRG